MMFDCFSADRGSLTLVYEKDMQGRPGLEDCSDVDVQAHPPDSLTNASYVWKIGYRFHCRHRH